MLYSAIIKSSIIPDLQKLIPYIRHVAAGSGPYSYIELTSEQDAVIFKLVVLKEDIHRPLYKHG